MHVLNSVNTKFGFACPTRVLKHMQRRQREINDRDEYLCIITAVALQEAGATAHLATLFPIAASLGTSLGTSQSH